MNKIYQRIDWENYPSSATPLNEDNLNKMDYAIDKLDDRIVTHETTKLNTATGNTLVKNVTFNEKTGVFTIEKLNGSKITINTALEKISTNFHFNPTTQKLVLTLIDGTVQEIDLSALITQYDFIESDTITFEIDASGKVKANILNGSITGEKLEPNYLANVTLQANNAKTSADNAKTSEKLAYQYAEEAKESASQTAKSDAKNITYDNTESGLSATNVKDALDEVAQGSVSAIAIDTTITDSTNAPLIYGKFKGYTEQRQYSGKNLLGKSRLVEAETSGVVYTPVYKDGLLQYINCNGTNTSAESLFALYSQNNSIPDELEKGVEYIASVNSTGDVNIQIYQYVNNAWSNILKTNTSKSFVISENATGLLVRLQVLTKGTSVSNVRCYPMIRLATVTDDTYEPYTGGIASPNPDYPQEINGLAKDGAIEVKTTRKNLINYDEWKKVLCARGTAVWENNGVTITSTGADAYLLYYHEDFPEKAKIYVVEGEQYTLSWEESSNAYGSAYVFGQDNRTIAYTKNETAKNLTFTIPSGITQISYRFGVQDSGVTISYKNIQIEKGDTATPYEPYTENTAAIPTDPLYEGDYLEVYADGSGRLVRAIAEVVLDGSDDEKWFYINPNLYVALSLSPAPKGSSVNLYSNYYLRQEKFDANNIMENALQINESGALIIGERRFATVAEWKAWLQSNPMKVVYELATPQEIELTAKQVAEFKKLYTFEPVTNVLCDGETEIQYYKNTPSGVAVGTVHRMANDDKATYDGDGNVIAETYAKKSNVLSSVAECEASTNTEDIAGASALSELNEVCLKVKNGANTTVDLSAGVKLKDLLSTFKLGQKGSYLNVLELVVQDMGRETYENAFLHMEDSGLYLNSTPFTTNLSGKAIVSIPIDGYVRMINGTICVDANGSYPKLEVVKARIIYS